MRQPLERLQDVFRTGNCVDTVGCGVSALTRAIVKVFAQLGNTFNNTVGNAIAILNNCFFISTLFYLSYKLIANLLLQCVTFVAMYIIYLLMQIHSKFS